MIGTSCRFVLALAALATGPAFSLGEGPAALPPVPQEAAGEPEAAARATTPGGERTFTFARFGTVHVYGDPATAKQVVLFASGDGGWELGVVDMARELASLDALVIGIDVVHFLHQVEAGSDRCAYSAADFEQLAQFVEKELGLEHYIVPVLVGYSSGATLVYALQAQAPPATFRGAISLGFCPDLWTAKSFCRGHGLESSLKSKGKGVLFAPATALETPWIVFQGDVDQVCEPAATAAFVGRVPHGELVALPKVGHGFSVPRNWLPQFKTSFARLADPPPASVPPEPLAAGPGTQGAAPPSDLPLVEVAATGPPGGPLAAATLAVVLSGDGGWAGMDKEIAGELARLGIPTVGWNSLQYYWHARTPEGAAADLTRVLAHYLPAWQRDRVLLVGYSFGADVLPFLVARLPESWRKRIDLVTLIAPSTTAQFEFHVAEWMGSTDASALPTAPEVARLAGLRVLCLQGEDDTESLCRKLPAGAAEVTVLGGGHHFGGGYAEVARRIVAALPSSAPAAP